MLKTFIFDKKGSAWLNSLRRNVFSGLIVPSVEHLIAKMPAATSATQPGLSGPIPLEGPQDARSELYSYTGRQGLVNIGLGTISSAGVVVTGVDTKFLTQLLVGDNIFVNGETKVVATISSDTSLTTTLAFAALPAGTAYAFSTTVNADVRDRMTVDITDTAWQRMLMNRPVLVNHVFGDNRKPLFLKESILLETNQTLMFRYQNNSTSATGSFGMTTECRKWQADAFRRSDVQQFITDLRKRKIWCQPYWLTLDDGMATIPASQSMTKFLTCTGDITLYLFNVYGQVISSGAAGDTQEKVEVSLQDVKTGRAMQNQPFTLNTGTGTSQNPFPLPAPWVIEPQTQIRADFKNLITDAPADVFLTLHGVAVYTGNRMMGGGLIDPSILAESRKIYNSTVPTIIPASPQ